jgi:hypothetical protein
MPPTTASEI